ncbi:unannotated protein [freshwater metagenome]|uniref:Unannotated protein n=1 Tax=freshwater metagenome TaxID=449393 RepID=A0A6J7IM08_9ZZZZ
MSRRSPSRWLAPAALVLVVIAALVIVSSSGSGGSAPTPAALDQDLERAPVTATTPTKTAPAPAGPATYTVLSGDTLSSISVATNVSVARLQELNPDLDAQALQPGQQLKLR